MRFTRSRDAMTQLPSDQTGLYGFCMRFHNLVVRHQHEQSPLTDADAWFFILQVLSFSRQYKTRCLFAVCIRSRHPDVYNLSPCLAQYRLGLLRPERGNLMFSIGPLTGPRIAEPLFSADNLFCRASRLNLAYSRARHGLYSVSDVKSRYTRLIYT